MDKISFWFEFCIVFLGLKYKEIKHFLIQYRSWWPQNDEDDTILEISRCIVIICLIMEIICFYLLSRVYPIIGIIIICLIASLLICSIIYLIHYILIKPIYKWLKSNAIEAYNIVKQRRIRKKANANQNIPDNKTTT